MEHQHDVVLEVLSSLGAADKPKIDVINKIDLLGTPPQWPGAIPVSAKTGEGMDALLEEIKRMLRGVQRPLRVEIPYAQGSLVSMLHESAAILREEYTDSGICVEVMTDEQTAGRLSARLGAKALTWLD